MKVTLGKIFFVLLMASCVACSGYSKLLKGKDHEKKYTKALEYYEKGKYSKTLQLLGDIEPVFRGTFKEDSLIYYIGASLYKRGDFLSSEEVFDDFRRRFGRSPFLEEAEYMYAKGFYYMSPSPERDQVPTRKAMMAIDEYLNRYPNSVKKEALQINMNELQRKLYDKAMLNAKVYYDIGYYNSATIALRNAIDAYPESPHCEMLSYLVVCSSYKYARNSVESKQRERYLNLQDAYYSFIADYPQSKYRNDADRMQNEAKRYLAKYGVKHGEVLPVADSVTVAPVELKQTAKELRKEKKAEKKTEIKLDIDHEVKKEATPKEAQIKQNKKNDGIKKE